MTRAAGAPGPQQRYLGEFAESAGYLDFARFGPPSRTVLKESADALTAAAEAGPATVDELMRSEARARAAVGRLTGFSAGDVITVPNTSTGLLQAAFAVAPGPDGPAEVVVGAGEFPANIYSWARAQEAGRVRLALTRMSGGMTTPDALRSALTPQTRAVAVSAVDFQTGYRADLAALRDVAGDRLLVVDGIQGFGAVEADWSAADILVVGGQKWLRSGWATGFLALSPRAAERVRPLLTGWTGVEDPVRYDGTLHERAGGVEDFSLTNLSPVATAAFAGALELVESVGAGWIERRISDRVEELTAAVESVGATVLSPREPGRRAGILTFALPGRTPAEIGAALREHGVSATVHARQVRLSPHASTRPEAAKDVHTALTGLLAGR
ncbi:aminotransferase class V-fold PLP-dependent enzyme [Streptacidiphilus griseoplanus]|uniref:aminotransferase class V-fold PLP-dependent enzyme n=1 Tax=Peterkaempfera griseoplana TaxID=66896 RepID=UPI0006E41DA5|nr:aminotransferase class V-fold PLP-dependent enzyme [Peterkaempfera griseoplana]